MQGRGNTNSGSPPPSKPRALDKRRRVIRPVLTTFPFLARSSVLCPSGRLPRFAENSPDGISTRCRTPLMNGWMVIPSESPQTMRPHSTAGYASITPAIALRFPKAVPDNPMEPACPRSVLMNIRSLSENRRGPRRFSDKLLIFINTDRGQAGSIGLSGTALGNLRAIAGVMLAYPAVECGLIVCGLSAGITIQPFIKGVLQRVDIPSGEFSANLGNRPLGQRTDDRAKKGKVVSTGRITRRRLSRARGLLGGGLPELVFPLPCIFALYHVHDWLSFAF